MNALATSCVIVVQTPAGKQSISGTLKRLSRTQVVVACDTQLPRDSNCELVFKSPEQDQLVRALCKVQENVYGSKGVDVYLKIERFADAHGSRLAEKAEHQ